jgi:hypothetical protein
MLGTVVAAIGAIAICVWAAGVILYGISEHLEADDATDLAAARLQITVREGVRPGRATRESQTAKGDGAEA